MISNALAIFATLASSLFVSGIYLFGMFLTKRYYEVYFESFDTDKIPKNWEKFETCIRTAGGCFDGSTCYCLGGLRKTYGQHCVSELIEKRSQLWPLFFILAILKLPFSFFDAVFRKVYVLLLQIWAPMDKRLTNLVRRFFFRFLLQKEKTTPQYATGYRVSADIPPEVHEAEMQQVAALEKTKST